MEYRRLPHGGEKEAEAVMTMALENGVNYFDMASADAVPFSAFGRALAGERKKVLFQIHFGANYQGGDQLAKDHYLHLEKKAGDCIRCGHCDSRCPFHVNQSQRMQEIASYFGE